MIDEPVLSGGEQFGIQHTALIQVARVGRNKLGQFVGIRKVTPAPRCCRTALFIGKQEQRVLVQIGKQLSLEREEIDAAKRPQEKLQSNTSISGMREPQKEAPLPAVLRA